MRGVWRLVVLAVLLTGAPAHATDPQSDRFVEESHEKELPASDTPFEELVWVVFDTETTGLSPYSDRVLEIGAVRYVGSTRVAERSWLIDPQRDIPEQAQRVHGITPEDVAGAPPFAAVYPEFAELAAGAVLMAHNANFDIQFLAAEIDRAGYAMPPNVTVDTLQLFRRLVPGLPSYRLASVAQHLGVEGGRYHRALDDAQYVADALLALIDRVGPKASLQDIYDNAGNLVFYQTP